ncbi:hypothetical protein ACJJIW_14810 [Microbulbifer sp. JMSA004]|uniref:hypothetical protein n=1 Tax=unclassified Microbulbifer TaxID=2619833 RepID=UPI00403B2E0D
MKKINSFMLLKVDSIVKQLFLPFFALMIGCALIILLGGYFEIPYWGVLLSVAGFCFATKPLEKTIRPLSFQLNRFPQRDAIEATVRYKAANIKGALVSASIEGDNLHVVTEGHKKSGEIKLPIDEVGGKLSSFLVEAVSNLEGITSLNDNAQIKETGMDVHKKVNLENISLLRIGNIRHFLTVKLILILVGISLNVWMLSFV